MSYIDYVNKFGVTVIQYTQDRYSQYEGFLQTLSRIGDPSYAFSVIVPIVSVVNPMLAADLLMVAAVNEWSNTLLKWLLKEDRPYWWVKETSIYKDSAPYLRQNILTCETGPGSPSGHVMGWSALLFVLVQAFIRGYSTRIQSDTKKLLLKLTFWSFYVISVVLMVVSRMYAATHFLHQCILGAIIGVLQGHYFTNHNSLLAKYWRSCGKLQMLTTVTMMSLISFGSYWLQRVMGIDPQWSVKLAFKWCNIPENISVNTTPLFSLVRDTGVGLGLAVISPVAKARYRHHMVVSVACVLMFCIVMHLVQMSVPTYNAYLFYICHGLLYATIPIVLISFTPKIAAVKSKYL